MEPVGRVSKVQFKKLVKTLVEPEDDEWKSQANCRGEDPNLFIYGSEIPSKKTLRQLSRMCQNCEVMVQCRIEGVRLMAEGWWGGMTEQERMAWAMEYLFKEDQ